jgi:hypothetical protein
LVFVCTHYHWTSQFGCEASSGDVAHADSNSCPTDVSAADNDVGWAAARYSAIRDKKVTTGLFYDVDGNEHDFTSGEDGDAGRANQILRDAGVAFPRRATVHPAAAHVETKAAARMRDNSISQGVMVINNMRGVCGADDDNGAYGCAQILAEVLPARATLVVWWPGPNGMANAKFTGGGNG